MKDRLINYFLKRTSLTPDETKFLSESMIIKVVEKGSCLVKEGEFNSDTYFILDGLVRQHRLVEGNDITTNFFTEEQWVISLENFDGQIPSNFSLTCVENTAVVVGDEKKAQELFEQFPKFETISRQIVESAFLEQQELMASYITDKPEERYLKLLKSRPEIFQRVPQYDIASYIGVKPESLSRIRKKILAKN